MTTGIVLMVLSCIGLSILQIKKKAWWLLSKSVYEPLTTGEMKIVKYSGLLFIFGLFLLFAGGYLEIRLTLIRPPAVKGKKVPDTQK